MSFVQQGATILPQQTAHGPNVEPAYANRYQVPAVALSETVSQCLGSKC